MTNFEQLAVFKLLTGSHGSAEQGLCAMEAVAWLEGLPHSDHPACTCPVIGGYVRALNDRLPDKERQRLVAYLPRLVGTVSPEHEWRRAHYLVAQSFQRAWPIILRALKLEQLATEFEQIGKKWEVADLAAIADLAARAARAAIAARADLAAIAAIADLATRAAIADRADLAARAAIAAIADLAALAAIADRADLAARAAIAARADLAAIADRAARAAIADRADLAARAAITAIAARADLYQVHFDMLDGTLAIGPQTAGFTQPVERRVEAYRELALAGTR